MTAIDQDMLFNDDLTATELREILCFLLARELTRHFVDYGGSYNEKLTSDVMDKMVLRALLADQIPVKIPNSTMDKDLTDFHRTLALAPACLQERLRAFRFDLEQAHATRAENEQRRKVANAARAGEFNGGWGDMEEFDARWYG